MGFSREENWSGFQCPPPGDLPDLGIKAASFTSPALTGMFFTISATWEASLIGYIPKQNKKFILKTRFIVDLDIFILILCYFLAYRKRKEN